MISLAFTSFSRQALIAYLLLMVFLILDPFLRRGEDARLDEAGGGDGSSAKLIGQAYSAAVLVPIIFLILPLPRIRLGNAVVWCAIVLMIAGLILRVVSLRILSAYYAQAPHLNNEEHLIESGPYRRVRHPGYLGTLLVWVGAGFAMDCIVAALLTAALLAKAFRQRMDAEEAMLKARFGAAYDRYERRTERLVPFVY